MKKFFAYSALCATLVAATSCGGNEVKEVPEPVEEPTAWTDVNAFDTNDVPTGSEVTNYGQNGQIVSVDKYMIDKETKKNLHTDHIIYQNGKPAFGKVLKEDGSVEGREIFTYDEKGLLKEQLIETYSEGLKRIAPSMRYVYTYDANGDVTSIKEQKTAPAPKGWTTEYEWTYTYDDKARVSGRADFTGEDKERKQSCKYMWTYEEGSNKIKHMDYFLFDLKLGKLKHDSKIEFKYNDAGRVTQKLIIRHKNNLKRDPINSRRYSYEYNAAGQVKSIYEEKWNNSVKEWAEVCNTLMDYDKAGQLVKWSSNKYTTKGPKFQHEVHTQGAPAETPNVAPAGEVYPIKPVINLDDKNATSNEED
ncbi:MAG: hypothetical protein K6E86_06305 [Bacteroidales bacterium]|nr:hypothetical protein [Bacteroidales bacterium]